MGRREALPGEHERHHDKLTTYEGYAPCPPPTGETRFDRAALEIGMRYERMAIDSWEDAERLVDTGEMPLHAIGGARARGEGGQA